MTIDSDDMISLPVPPPPRPAARRAAIDAALRKFDGIEDPLTRRDVRRPSLARWASSHRRPVGALVTVALVAVISIPAIQVALRDHPIEVASEDRQPSPVRPGEAAAQEEPAFEESAAKQTIANEPALPAQSRQSAPAAAAENRSGFAAGQRDEKTVAPAPLAIAPAEPPIVAAPPPPPPAPEMKAQDSAAGNIVVTGSRIQRQNLESAMPVTVVGDTYADFVSHLQAGLEANDRRAVIGLIGFPLRVNWNGDTRTYRTAKDVERDYDRIFSPNVRQSLIDQRSDTLTRRDGGRLMGNGRVWFGCGLRSCSSDATIRIREVNP
jgi:hypothetical protein